jgi:hypothetical protein
LTPCRSWRIEFEIEDGALLVLKDRPTKVHIDPSRQLINYIEANQEHWYKFLDSRLDCPAWVVDESRLILVTSIVRSRNWSIGAWSKLPQSISLAYTLPEGYSSASNFGRGWDPTPAFGVRDGPSGSETIHPAVYDFPDLRLGDQTLFIEGYRIGNRSLRRPLRTLSGKVVSGSPAPSGLLGSVWTWLAGGNPAGNDQPNSDNGYPLSPPPSETSRPTSSGHSTSQDVVSPSIVST